MWLSLAIPVYNEAHSLPLLIDQIEKALSPKPHEVEVIFIDDGSRDNSFEIITGLARERPWIKAVRLRRNYGQTIAIQVGIEHAQGEVIVLMDSDLENDPADIPRLLAKLEEGYDVVSGWRQNRWKSQWLTRKLPSLLANKLISWLSGVPLHDYGCTLKAYRREFITAIRLYGHMHRFIPIYAKWEGGRITELPVRYQPRRFGKSNYGLMRTFSVLLDLIFILFLDRYLQRPMQFFGGLGLLSLIIAMISFLLAAYYKLSGLKDFVETPLPEFTALFGSVSVMLISMGILGEMLVRIYYEATGRPSAQIKEKIGFHDQTENNFQR